MNNGYGQIFLLLLAIGLILLGASGKGKAVWDALKGTSGTSSQQPEVLGPTTQQREQWTTQQRIDDADKAGSGNGGLLG